MKSVLPHIRRVLSAKACGALLAAVAMALPACTSVEKAAPPNAWLNAKGQTAQCVQGRQIYLGACTKCHSPEPIRKHSLADWQGDIMPTMAKKAKLQPAQATSVMAYVSAVIESPVVEGPPKS